jgi:Fe-S cluster assembly protein SufD
VHQFTPDAAAALPGPEWLKKRRAEAAERFAAEPMPSPDAEEWRYSPIDDLDLERFSLAAGNGSIAPVPEGLPEKPAAMISIANDRVQLIEVDDHTSAVGASVTVIGPNGAEAESLGSVSDDAADHFTVLNDAFAQSPVLIDIPAGVQLDGPIVVHHHVSGDGTVSFPRVVVNVGRDADARVLDIVTSTLGDAALVCPVVELNVEAAGRLGYLGVQRLSTAAWQIGSQLSRVERDSTLTAATAVFGGGYARTRADTRLVGRGAHGDLLSMYFGEGDQTLDFRTYQDHVAPDTTSNLLYKGAVGGSARSIYTGLIRVRPAASGTNAYQTNRNLKLSEDAWAESVPNLEIENHDVRCSHASAVGPVDLEQIFYLESRGVPTDVAERLIVAGFFDEVIVAIPVPSVAPALRSAIADKLARLAA